MTSRPKNAAVRKAVIGAGATIGSGVGATVVATAKAATVTTKFEVIGSGVSTTTIEGPVWALFAISPMGTAVILGACAAGGAVATHQLLSWWDKRNNTM